MSIDDLEKHHVGLKMKCGEVSAHASTVLLLCQTIQDQQQLLSAMGKHADTLMERLKPYERATKKDPDQDGSTVRVETPAAT